MEYVLETNAITKRYRGFTALSGLTMRIPKGSIYGFVGRNGAGKTTLTKLLLRLADIQEGEILVDGQNVADVTQQSLRRQIAYVPQEALLFHRTIAENIAYGRPDATMEEIREAARAANALEFIEALPQGFATITGERGIKLSGGQRQRIAIARALLHDSPVFVFDEATSSVDMESEELILDTIRELAQSRGKTVIMITHRMANAEHADQVVVLEHGKSVERGTHTCLLYTSDAVDD